VISLKGHKPSCIAVASAAIVSLLKLASDPGCSWAQSQSELRDRLMNIYALTISVELCDFPMTNAQAAAIGKAGDDLEDQIGISEDEAQRLYDQLQRQMSEQQASGLCDPKGRWAMKFKESVAKFSNN
jgi:hypothetical protein